MREFQSREGGKGRSISYPFNSEKFENVLYVRDEDVASELILSILYWYRVQQTHRPQKSWSYLVKHVTGISGKQLSCKITPTSSGVDVLVVLYANKHLAE